MVEAGMGSGYGMDNLVYNRDRYRCIDVVLWKTEAAMTIVFKNHLSWLRCTPPGTNLNS